MLNTITRKKVLCTEYHKIKNLLVWGCPLCNMMSSPGFGNHIYTYIYTQGVSYVLRDYKHL